MSLIRDPNLVGADDIYEKLIALHADCSTDESMRRNARLIIALCNHIGDASVIAEAIALAGGESARRSAD